MHVGILTMHRVRNWGSFLQAYALKRIVEEFGHKCSFIDIMPNVGVEDPETQPNRFQRQVSAIRQELGRLRRSAQRGEFLTRLRVEAHQHRFNRRYDHAFLPMLGVGKRYSCDGDYDVVIIGSDEVFNVLQPEATWYKTLHLYGEGIDARKIVTYAASFGRTTLADLNAAGLRARISHALRHVSKCSVRDANSYGIIEQLTGSVPELCVDPVFLYDFDSLVPDTIPHNDYIMVYSYHGRTHDANCIRVLKEYARRHSMKCMALFGYCDWCDQSIMPRTPFELLRYFANAHFVFTDTFHGAVFAIKYNRNMCAMVHGSHRKKLGYLLQQMELTERTANSAEDILLRLETPIDYARTNRILNAEVIKGMAYLKDALCTAEGQREPCTA